MASLPWQGKLVVKKEQHPISPFGSCPCDLHRYSLKSDQGIVAFFYDEPDATAVADIVNAAPDAALLAERDKLLAGNTQLIGLLSQMHDDLDAAGVPHTNEDRQAMGLRTRIAALLAAQGEVERLTKEAEATKWDVRRLTDDRDHCEQNLKTITEYSEQCRDAAKAAQAELAAVKEDNAKLATARALAVFDREKETQCEVDWCELGQGHRDKHRFIGQPHEQELHRELASVREELRIAEVVISNLNHQLARDGKTIDRLVDQYDTADAALAGLREDAVETKDRLTRLADIWEANSRDGNGALDVVNAIAKEAARAFRAEADRLATAEPGKEKNG